MALHKLFYGVQARKSLVCTLVALLFASGCAQKTVPPSQPQQQTPKNIIALKKNKKKQAIKPKLPQKAITLNSFFNEWQGTKYRYGGTTKRGIDCSAFTQLAYRTVYKKNLPRTVYWQKKIGRRISKKSLKRGDLIFFAPKGRISHVGIYMGNSYFIHASTSKGVIQSTLNNNYWRRAYATARTLRPAPKPLYIRATAKKKIFIYRRTN